MGTQMSHVLQATYSAGIMVDSSRRLLDWYADINAQTERRALCRTKSGAGVRLLGTYSDVVVLSEVDLRNRSQLLAAVPPSRVTGDVVIRHERWIGTSTPRVSIPRTIPSRDFIKNNCCHHSRVETSI
jgi:hypothetical protein